MPRVKSTSFTDTGTPCSRPSASPFSAAISASRARRRATSCATRAKALRRGLTASMRARTASVSSTGDSSLRRIKAAHSTAERQTTSSAAIVTSSPPRHCIIRPVAADATRMRRDAAGRPAGEQDRHGSALSALEWSPDGRLSRASVRLPDGGWVSIEPGAGAAGPWGASDLVTRDGRPLTRLAALDWARVDRIPPLAEPARLPAGAGTAIFNLLARLAAEQGVAVLRYDAPYPTEALFLALLESFRYVPEEAPHPMDAFARGWRPRSSPGSSRRSWPPARPRWRRGSRAWRATSSSSGGRCTPISWRCATRASGCLTGCDARWETPCAAGRAPTRSPRASPRFARRPTSSPTACARALRGRSPPSPRTCKSPRWSTPGRRRPTRAPSPPPPRPWREKPREDDRGAPRFIRGAPSVGGFRGAPRFIRGAPSVRGLEARAGALGARRAL